MIISYKHNFAVVNIPKCGSNSTAKVIGDSGILDEKQDIWPGRKTPIKHPAFLYPRTKPWNKPWRGKLRTTSRPVLNSGARHLPWELLIDLGLAKETMECIAFVRNPIDKVLSAISFFFETRGVEIKESDFSYFWDGYLADSDEERIDEFKMRGAYTMEYQHSYLNQDPTVYKLENFGPRITELVERCGGTVKEVLHLNKSKERPSNDQLLTKERQQQILDFYADDFILWENAK